MKQIYAMVIMALMAMNVNAAGELADWYIYVWNDAANKGGDRGQFKTTETDGVFVLEGVTLTEDDAAGLKFCMRNGDWSVMYGWDDAGSSLDATDKVVKLASATGATGWMALPAGKYDFTWNVTELTITATISSVVTPEAPIPTELKVYDGGETPSLMGTLAAVMGEDGKFAGQITSTASWQQFYVEDEENSISYGASAAGLSSGDDKYNMWVGEDVGVYDIEIDLKAMTWKATFNGSATGISNVSQYSGAAKVPENEYTYNFAGQRSSGNVKGLIIKKGRKYIIR